MRFRQSAGVEALAAKENQQFLFLKDATKIAQTRSQMLIDCKIPKRRIG